MLSRLIWLSLSSETRQKLKILLSIPRTGGTEVVDGRVVSDGYTDRDLQVITLERLQELAGSTESDFYKLFNQLVQNVENPPLEVVNTPQEEVITEALSEHPDYSGNINPENIPMTNGVTYATTKEGELPRINKGGRPKGSVNKN